MVDDIGSPGSDGQLQGEWHIRRQDAVRADGWGCIFNLVGRNRRTVDRQRPDPRHNGLQLLVPVRRQPVRRLHGIRALDRKPARRAHSLIFGFQRRHGAVDRLQVVEHFCQFCSASVFLTGTSDGEYKGKRIKRSHRHLLPASGR